jgi:hypothetical protein
MNTNANFSTSTAQRASSMALAAALTFGMLFAVNSLASSEPTPAQLARAAAHQQACNPV